MESILSLDHIYYSYHDKNGETPVINDLSFEIKPGSFTSIVGPSGCGKSTLLSLLCDLIKPEAGTIYIKPPQNNTDSRMGYMLQKDNLFEWRSIYKNVMFVLESFREKGVQIEEVKSSNKKYKNEDSLKYFLENSKVEVFKDIKDPVAWQNSIRNEWK